MPEAMCKDIHQQFLGGPFDQRQAPDFVPRWPASAARGHVSLRRTPPHPYAQHIVEQNPSNYCKYILGTLSQNRYGLFLGGGDGGDAS